MIRAFSLDELPHLKGPIHLTIGNFDGIHLGHRALLSHLVKKGGTSVVITFSNHPSKLFTNKTPLPLCSLTERLDRLEETGVTVTCALPFTKELSLLSYKEFLDLLRKKIPFTSLVLGKGATFGFERLGTEDNIQKLGLKAEYLPKFIYKGEPLSSKRIREWLENEEFEEVAYSLSKTSASG